MPTTVCRECNNRRSDEHFVVIWPCSHRMCIWCKYHIHRLVRNEHPLLGRYYSGPCAALFSRFIFGSLGYTVGMTTHDFLLQLTTDLDTARSQRLRAARLRRRHNRSSCHSLVARCAFFY